MVEVSQASRKYNISRDQIPCLVEKSRRILRVKGRYANGITRVSPTEIELSSGEKIMTRTLFWTGGVRANHLIAGLGLRTGGCNRIEVNKFLTATFGWLLDISGAGFSQVKTNHFNSVEAISG